MSDRDQGELDRRDFLRVVGAGALGAALAETLVPGVVLSIARAQGVGAGAASPVNVVAVAKDPSPAEIEARIREAILATTDLKWLEAGQLVAVKVVSNSARPYPFTTHPEALKAVVKILRERGARVVVADQAGTKWVMAPFVRNDTVARKIRELWGDVHSGFSDGMSVLRANGLAQAAESAGATVRSFDHADDWVAAPATEHWPKGFRVPKLANEADHLVNLVRPGGHVMAGHTGTVKSWYGWLHPDDRIASHTDVGLVHGPSVEVKHLHECIAEVAGFFAKKTRLNLTVGIGTYSDIGPDWGAQPLEQNLVIASTDMAAADAVTAALIAYEKHRVPESERAKR